MILEIVTPEKILFKGEVKLVKVPGSNGSFAMLRSHAPIISTLEKGIIKVLFENKEKYFELLETAVVENHNDTVSILAENIRETGPVNI